MLLLFFILFYFSYNCTKKWKCQDSALTCFYVSSINSSFLVSFCRPPGGDEHLDLGHHSGGVGRQVGGHAQQPQHARSRRTRSDAARYRCRGDSGVEPGQTRERQGEALQPVQQEEIDARPPLTSAPSSLPSFPPVLFEVAPRHRSIVGHILVEDVRVSWPGLRFRVSL